jgi:hypothetical protein
MSNNESIKKIKIKKNIFIRYMFIVFCLFLIILPACKASTSGVTTEVEGGGKPKPITQITKTETPPPSPSKSEKLNTKIFFDFTPSMAGFINEERPSIYMQTMLLLEKASLSCWPDSKISFFKFGNSLKELVGRKEYLKVNTKDFYNLIKIDKKNNDSKEEVLYENVETKIDLTLDSASTKELNVIVTDLFQDEQDLTYLVEIINKKFLSEDLAVGILGIRSEFNGFIYDFGIDNVKIDYDSGTVDPKKFRPFYIILLGSPPDINSYYEKLKNSIEDFPEHNFFMVSSVFFPKFDVTSLAKISSVKESDVSVVNLVAQSGLIDNKYNKDVLQWGILKDDISKREVHLKSPYFIKKYGKDYTNDNLETGKRAFIFDPNDGSKSTEMSQTKFEEAFDINQIMKENNLNLDIIINPNSLPEDQIIMLEINAFLNDNRSNEFPEWIDEWSMSLKMMVDIIDDITKGQGSKEESGVITYKSDKFDGGKTMNFDMFITNLNAKNCINYKAQIASYNFIFWKY